jgi:hemolysin activation/secretion protein
MLRSRLQRWAVHAALAGGCLSCLSWSVADAQSPIQDRPITRPLEQPGFLPPEQSDVFQLPPVYTLEPEAQDMPRDLEVKGFEFEGNTVFPTADLQQLAAPYAGRKNSCGELEQLRQKLTLYYVERGYINSGALLPDDFYRNGIVHFRIVEGRLKQIRAKGLGGLRESYLKQRLGQGDEPLNVNELQERFQLLLTDPLFSKINARLQPGAEPGEAILDVDVTRGAPPTIFRCT